VEDGLDEDVLVFEPVLMPLDVPCAGFAGGSSCVHANKSEGASAEASRTPHKPERIAARITHHSFATNRTTLYFRAD
jgi:hypothetical protein